MFVPFERNLALCGLELYVLNERPTPNRDSFRSAYSLSIDSDRAFIRGQLELRSDGTIGTFLVRITS